MEDKDKREGMRGEVRMNGKACNLDHTYKAFLKPSRRRSWSQKGVPIGEHKFSLMEKAIEYQKARWCSDERWKWHETCG
jgi:hypothetical protein